MQDDSTQNNSQYQNPVDGKTYATNGQWQDYQPQNPQPVSQDSKVVLDNVRLLTDQTTVAANLSTEQLSQYIKDVTAAVTGATEGTSAPFQLILQLELSPSDTPKLQLADQGGADNTVLQKVYDATLAVTAPSPSAQALSFQVMFNVNSPTQP
jgi:hypothetical protein